MLTKLDSLSSTSALANLKQILLNMSLDFSTLSVESMQTCMDQIRTLSHAVWDEIATLSPEQLSFKTVIQPLIDLDVITQAASTLCTHPKEVHPDEAVRKRSTELSEELQKLDLEGTSREDVFAVFQRYQQKAYLVEQANLHGEEIRFIDDLERTYRRQGLYLSDEQAKKRVQEISNRLSELCIQFEQNVSEDTTSFEMTREELQGLPEDWFSKERELPEGKFRVTLKYPDVFPILDYATNRATREKISLAFSGRCQEKNMPILKEVLECRAEKARLLGYEHHAALELQSHMVKTTQDVKKFLDEMNERFTPLLDKNMAELTQFAREVEQNPEFVLQKHDVAYYRRQREDKLFDVDAEVIRQYFPLERVIKGTLEIYSTLLGLDFTPTDQLSTWHSDVVCFEAHDSQTKKKLGNFYLDLHPRDGKFSHAMATGLLYGCDLSTLTGIADDRRLNQVAMVCNFPKNSTLPFDDVQTFFHEFGHVMHFLCAKTKLASSHSNFTEVDFVEAPSQMLENWCFEPKALKILSSHVKTGESLPDEIVSKLKGRETLHAGYTQKRQLVFAYFDYYIHTMSLERIQSTKSDDIKFLYQKLQQELTGLPIQAGDCTPASFGHMIGGYDAGYYGYMRSETDAKDLFYTLFKADPLSKERGAQYRQTILEAGSSVDAGVMLQTILGRTPNIDAFLEYYGVAPQQAQLKKSLESSGSERRVSDAQQSPRFFQVASNVAPPKEETLQLSVSL